MNRAWSGAALGIGLSVQTAIAAPNGYIAVFSDNLGTRCCFSTHADGSERMYVYAVTGGASAAGISGAEFRVAVGPPAAGATFLWIPTSDLSVSLGNPVDNGMGGGASLLFDQCQTQTGLAGDKVKLGEIYARDLTTEHKLVVRTSDTLTNRQFACPSVTLCDGPVFTPVCLTLKKGDSALHSEEPAAFVSAVNSPSCSGTSCGFVAAEAQSWTAMKGLYR